MKHLQVATFKSIRDELLANTIETGAAIVQVYIPGVSEDTLCLPYRSYVKSILNEGESIENNERAKGFIISPWSGKSPDPINYIGDQEVLYEDVNFRFKSAFTTTNCSITPDQGNTLLLGSNYKATVTADANYVLDSVVVKVGGQTVQSGTNANIDLNNILGDVEITAVATLNNYTIDYVNIIDSDCVESTNTSRSIDHGLTYTTTIRKKEGYATLGPGSVTVGGVQMDSWNEQSGDKEISVVATGNIVIKVDECGDKYKYTAQLAQGLSNCVTLTGPTSNIEYGSTYRATLTHTAEYTNLGAITVTMGGNPVRTYPAGETQIDLVINGVNGNIVIDGECGTQETYSITLDKDCVTLVSPASPTNIQRGSDVHITLQKGQSYLNFGPGTISSPGKETIGIPSGITEFDTIINNVEGNITINIESCGDPIPTDYPVTINWVRQSDNQIIHTETQEHVQAGTTIHPEDYENDWDFSGYTEYEIKSMNPTRGTSIVVNEPKTIIYYCGLKDVPVSKYEVEVKYVTEESGQYVSIQGPTSDYTLGEYDEGTVLVSNQQSINTSNTNDYNFFSFDPATLTVSASSKTIYVVYVPKGNHTINYYNINNNECVTNDKSTTSDSVAEGSSYSVTLTLDTDKYISAEVTISGAFTDTITLDSANPQRTVTFTVTTDTDITATCGQNREYTVTYNHVAITEESEEIIADTEVLSEEYGTELSISDIENKRKSYPSEQYSEYIQDAGEYYSIDEGSNFHPIPQTLIIQCDTIINIYYSKTPQGQIRFDYYIDDNLVTSQTVTEDVGTSVTLNDYKDLPSDIQNPEYYEFDSFDPDVQTITVNDSTQIVKVYYTTKKITLTFKYYDQMVSPPVAIDGVEPVQLDINMGSQYCEADFGEKKKTIEHYTYVRSSLNGGCQTFTENSDIILYYNKKVYQITYRYINQESQEQLRKDIITTAPYKTTINLNTNKKNFDGYEFVDWNVDPETTIEDGKIILTEAVTITYYYISSTPVCEPTCNLDTVSIDLPRSQSYDVSSSIAETQEEIISDLANKILMIYKYADQQNPEYDTVHNLGWDIVIPDNIQPSDSNPYTGSVIDCECNEHEFIFYYREQPVPYIDLLVGCFHLRPGEVVPVQGEDFDVYPSDASVSFETHVDDQGYKDYITITATYDGKSYSTDLNVCPYFKVKYDSGEKILIRSGQYDTEPWYGSECTFTVESTVQNAPIVRKVTAVNGPIAPVSMYMVGGEGSKTNYYGTESNLGTTYEDDYYKIEINDTGSIYTVTLKNIQGDIEISADNFPRECLNQKTFRFIDEETGQEIVPSATYYISNDASGYYIKPYSEYTIPSNYKYKKLKYTNGQDVNSVDCEHDLYDMIYTGSLCEIECVYNYDGTSTTETNTYTSPPGRIDLPLSPQLLYFDYIIDSVSSTSENNLTIASNNKSILIDNREAECGQTITFNLSRDPDPFKCQIYLNPRLIINRLLSDVPEEVTHIDYAKDGHYYTCADKYNLYSSGRKELAEEGEFVNVEFNGTFVEGVGYLIYNPTTVLSGTNSENECNISHTYHYYNYTYEGDSKYFVIPYEHSGIPYESETAGQEDS